MNGTATSTLEPNNIFYCVIGSTVYDTQNVYRNWLQLSSKLRIDLYDHSHSTKLLHLTSLMETRFTSQSPHPHRIHWRSSYVVENLATTTKTTTHISRLTYHGLTMVSLTILLFISGSMQSIYVYFRYI